MLVVFAIESVPSPTKSSVDLIELLACVLLFTALTLLCSQFRG